MSVKTENFSLDTDPKLACGCGHPDCDKRTVNQEHLERVQLVRTLVGHGLIVTSGGRCPLHPREQTRRKPMDHQLGNGCDVYANGSTRGNIVAAGLAAGCNAIGVAKTFVHLGYRADLAPEQTVMWVY